MVSPSKRLIRAAHCLDSSCCRPAQNRLTRISAQDVRRNPAGWPLWQPAGRRHSDLLERYGLTITVTVGGSAIRVPDDANLICYQPGTLRSDARFAGSGTGQIVTGGQTGHDAGGLPRLASRMVHLP
jgi:hypothetical protein